MIEIRGKMYVCEDRIARRYGSRFDISCDQDKRCPYEVAGWMAVKVLLVGRTILSPTASPP